MTIVKTKDGVELVGVKDAPSTEGNVLYVVVTGNVEDVDLVRGYTDGPTVGVWGGKNARAAVDELVSIVRPENFPSVAVIAPHNVEKYAAIADELTRRLHPDRTFLTRRGDWGCLETVAALGEAAARALIERSRLTPISSVLDASDLIELAMETYDNPQRDAGWETGWTLLDSHYRPAPGYFTIVTGVPSHGKSTWLDALLVQLAQLHDFRFAVFSPESYPVQRHLMRLAARVAARPYCGHQRMERNTMRNALEFVSEHFHVYDPDISLGIEAILEGAEKLLRRHGIQGLVIDPWNEIEHLRPREVTETEYVSAVLGKVRRWARAHRVHVWVVAHPAKPEKKRKKRGDDDDSKYVPTPYDISGSANWYNKGDACITIWREPEVEGGYTHVHVQKIRVQPEHGKPDVVLMAHDKWTGLYRDVPIDGKTQIPGSPRPSRVPADFLARWIASRTQQQQAA